jgi:uncharacterized protein YqeY
MGLKEQIQSDIVVAMKAHEKDRTDALRLLKAAIQRFELDHTDSKSPLYGKPIDEESYLGVVVKEIKQRKDSIEQFQKGGRQDLVEKEEAELRIFESYLPTQLSREEVVQAITAIVEREGKEFKKVMPAAAKELKGKADGKIVSEVVRELTS